MAIQELKVLSDHQGLLALKERLEIPVPRVLVDRTVHQDNPEP